VSLCRRPLSPPLSPNQHPPTHHPTNKPTKVIVNGSHSLHAVGDAGASVCSADGSERLRIGTLDAALVSPDHPPRVLPNVKRQPDVAGGVSFNLFNNVWGTNYVM